MPTLAELAERFDLTVKGDSTRPITGVCPLEPGQEEALAYLGDRRHRGALATTRAAAVIVPPDLADEVEHGLIAEQPLLAFAGIAGLFAPDDRPPTGLGEHCVVDPSADLAPDVRLGAGCVVGARSRIGAGCALGVGCVVGDDVVMGEGADIAPRVVIGGRVTIGARALILPGAVIGSRGFGNVHDGKHWHAVPQLGGVCVGDDVEIGANTTIDRGAMGDTVIEDNVRIDNLCQIAHNVRIGRGSALAAGVGVAGSAVIGRGCMLGGQSGVNGHIELTDGVIVSGGTKVFQSISEPGQYASGLPAMPAMAWRRLTVVLGRLEQRLKSLERRMRS